MQFVEASTPVPSLSLEEPPSVSFGVCRAVIMPPLFCYR